MSERFLNHKQVAERLCMSSRSFYRRRAKFIALGLQMVKIGQGIKYREASLDKLIQTLSEQGGAI